jgi:uncharacterized membrane protein
VAALSPGQIVRVYTSGDADRVTLYALKKVTSGDTADLAADFLAPKQAFMMGATVVGTAVVSTITGTVLTIPAGLSNDAAWILVWGVSA